MRPKLETVLFTISLAVVLAVTGATAAAEPSVGLRQQALETSPSEQIELAIWYPTDAASKPVTLGPYMLDVALNAAARKGPFPLIMLSHGTGGNSMNQQGLATALARGGFIVAALTHPGDNYRDRSLVGKPAYFSERPRQVSRAIDALLADSAWKPLIDADRIGFLGHSAGGFTGAALIGATPSIANTVRHCAANYDEDLWFCRVSGSKEKAIENARNAEYIPTVPASPDPRIKAAVLVAPVGAFFPETSLKNIKVPVRVYVAGRDEVLTPRFHAGYLARTIPGAETVEVEGGGHFMLVSKLNLAVAVNGAEVNADPPGFDRAPVIAEAARQLPLWFTRALGK